MKALALVLLVVILVPSPAQAQFVELGVSCSYTVSILSCTDVSDYASSHALKVDWYVDGRIVATTAPGETMTVSSPIPWTTYERDVELMTIATLDDGTTPGRSWILHIVNTSLWVVLGILSAVLVAAAVRMGHSKQDRGILFEAVSNPNYREQAIKVEEKPNGWTSYRLRDPSQYTRFRSRRDGDRWIVYGIRTTTRAERARTGRKYVAEVQAVRERIR